MAYQAVFRTTITRKQKVRQRRIGQGWWPECLCLYRTPTQVEVWLASRSSLCPFRGRGFIFSFYHCFHHPIWLPRPCKTCAWLSFELEVPIGHVQTSLFENQGSSALQISYTWLKSCSLPTSECFISPHCIISCTVVLIVWMEIIGISPEFTELLCKIFQWSALLSKLLQMLISLQ